MDESVMQQEVAEPEQKEIKTESDLSIKEFNFRKLEAAREEERERRIRLEMENANLKQRLDGIELRLQPKEVDPLDEVEDFADLDKTRLKAALNQRDQRLMKEAEAIAERRVREIRKEEEQQNHMHKLKGEFSDFHEVVNENSVLALEKTDPDLVEALLDVKDDYKRKKLVYQYLKKNAVKAEPKPSIKQKVEENQRNPFYIPTSAGTPGAVDYDIKSPQARQAAYDKLKAAQRRPLGGDQGAPNRG